MKKASKGVKQVLQLHLKCDCVRFKKTEEGSFRGKCIIKTQNEPHHEKTGFSHMPKQRRRSASR